MATQILTCAWPFQNTFRLSLFLGLRSLSEIQMTKAPKVSLPISGGCQCGQLRYEVTEPISTLYCCHCTECQGQASSAFGMSARVAAHAVSLKGEYGSFYRDQGQPNAVEGVFCTKCGTRIMHRGRGEDAGTSIKAGSLYDKSWLEPVGHIWTKSAQKWVKLDGLIYETQPDDNYAALIAAFDVEFSP